MTPRKYEQENPPGIEKEMERIGRQVSDLVKTIHGMYDNWTRKSHATPILECRYLSHPQSYVGFGSYVHE